MFPATFTPLFDVILICPAASLVKLFPFAKLSVFTRLLNNAVACCSLVWIVIWFKLTPPTIPAFLAMSIWPPTKSTFPAVITLPLIVIGAPPFEAFSVASARVAADGLFFKLV